MWRPKKNADVSKLKLSADVNMVFFMPAEYGNRSEGEDGEEMVAHLVLHSQQAQFDKP